MGGKEQVDWNPVLIYTYGCKYTDISLRLTWGFLLNSGGHFTQDSVRKRNQRHSLGVL